MNTPVKRANLCTAGKKCNPSRSPSKYRKGPFPPKRGHRVPKRTKSQSVLDGYRISGNRPISTLSALI